MVSLRALIFTPPYVLLYYAWVTQILLVHDLTRLMYISQQPYILNNDDLLLSHGNAEDSPKAVITRLQRKNFHYSYPLSLIWWEGYHKNTMEVQYMRKYNLSAQIIQLERELDALYLSHWDGF